MCTAYAERDAPRDACIVRIIHEDSFRKKALLSNGKSAFSILFSVDGNLAFQPCGSSGTGSGDGFSWIMMCLISG